MTATLLAVPYAATDVAVTNLVTNPSVEVDTTGWAFSSDVAASGSRLGPFVMGEHAPLGIVSRWFYRCAWTANSATILGGINYSVLAGLTPGQPYSGRFAFRSSKTQRLQLTLSWRNAAGSIVGTDAQPAIVAAPMIWTWLTFTNVVAPATAARLVLTVYAVAGASASPWLNGDTLDGDMVQLVQSTTLPDYFDGSTSSAGLIGKRYAWTGTPHASTSTFTTRTATGAGALTPELVTDYAAQRASMAVLHEVIGRPDPVPALGALRTRTGTLTIWCSTLALAQAVVDLYAVPRVVMLRDPSMPQLDMYHVATSTRLSPVSLDPLRWAVDVAYTELYSSAAAW